MMKKLMIFIGLALACSPAIAQAPLGNPLNVNQSFSGNWTAKDRNPELGGSKTFARDCRIEISQKGKIVKGTWSVAPTYQGRNEADGGDFTGAVAANGKNASVTFSGAWVDKKTQGKANLDLLPSGGLRWSTVVPAQNKTNTSFTPDRVIFEKTK